MSMYKTREILCVRYVCAPQAAKWCAQPTQMHARGTMKIARDCFVCRGGLLPPLRGGNFFFSFLVPLQKRRHNHEFRAVFGFSENGLD